MAERYVQLHPGAPIVNAFASGAFTDQTRADSGAPLLKLILLPTKHNVRQATTAF